ncbi:MAG: glycosyltransferase [Planctomycetes bacterium]|nr:glycosyltransferase [Planctomycetota bacterium]
MNRRVDTEEAIQHGILLAKQGMLHKALALFKGILQTHPHEPRALINAALIFNTLGEKNKALALLQHCTQIAPSLPDAHYFLGTVYLQNNCYTEAYNAFRSAITCDIEYNPAYEGLQKALSAMGKSIPVDSSDIVFYTGGLPFHGKTMEETGLGGSESALIYMARSIASNGLRVRVYCNCNQPGNYDGVEYSNLTDFHIYRKLHTFPILISSRSLLPFKFDLKARKRILWIHDDTNVAFLEKENPATLPIDKIFSISQWQRNEWSNYFGIPKERFFLTRNGVDLTIFAPGEKRYKNRLIYFSRPNRGLNILLELFPHIRNEVPDAELHIFTYHVPEDENIESFLYQLKRPGIFIYGSLTKKDLAQEIAQSRLMVYPSTFRETSCMAAIESQATGTPVVASTLAALPETIIDNVSGRLIPGDPHSSEFKTNFINMVIYLLKNNTEWERLSKGAQDRCKQHYDWKIIAKEWISELTKENTYENINMRY